MAFTVSPKTGSKNHIIPGKTMLKRNLVARYTLARAAATIEKLSAQLEHIAHSLPLQQPGRWGEFCRTEQRDCPLGEPDPQQQHRPANRQPKLRLILNQPGCGDPRTGNPP